MVQKYKVTLILTAEGYMDLAPLLGSHSPKIEKIIDKTVSEELDPSAMSAPRGKRKSKVIESIINRLKELGTGNASQLRHALAAAGLSESSLSTGLAILQKSGQIKRDDDGAYYLSAREAA